MPPLFETVTDLTAQADVVRRRRYGVIEVVAGQFQSLRLRPFPKLFSLSEIIYWDERWVRRASGDRCLLYYNQPRNHPNFLALKYIVSSRDCSLKTFRRTVFLLDEIARIKRSDALLCDASNLRISDRLFARWGWQAHRPQRWHRNFIKRFYGEYPQHAAPSTANAAANHDRNQDNCQITTATPSGIHHQANM